MLDQSDALLSIAEIAATFAGFAALVTLFGRRRVAGTAAHDLLRLRLVIATSVVVVLTALVPVALAGYGLANHVAWIVAAGISLPLRYLAIASFIASYQNVRGSFPPDRLAVAVAGMLELLVQAALLAILFGLAGPRETSLYISSLVATLGQASFVFLRLVESTFGTIVVRPEALPNATDPDPDAGVTLRTAPPATTTEPSP
ncbi:MAG: hypothetical protein RIC56_15790 [Pseudomonadales bacterium]